MTLSRKQLFKKTVIDLSLRGYTITEIWRELIELGITKESGARYSKKAIAGVLRSQRNKWADEMKEQADELMAQNLAEIRYIKKALHQEGDYKLLAKYLDMEQRVLKPKAAATRIGVQNNAAVFITAAERIRALQLAAESEAIIEERNREEAERMKREALEAEDADFDFVEGE